MGSRDGWLADRVALARHLELIELATQAARRDERILAAWLSGSLASDFADQFSDIDFHVVVREEDFGAFAESGWADFVSGLAPTVLTRSFGSGRGGFAITSDWMHFDVALHRLGDQLFRDGAGIRPLFDRTGGLLPKASATHSIERGEPYFPVEVVEWFFYMLGNLAVVVGRDEPVLGTNGAVMLRDTCLVPLMHGEEGRRQNWREQAAKGVSHRRAAPAARGLAGGRRDSRLRYCLLCRNQRPVRDARTGARREDWWRLARQAREGDPASPRAVNRKTDSSLT